MKLEDAKDLATQLLSNAQILLEKDHGIHPVLFAVTKELQVKPVMVKLGSEEDRNNLVDLMKELSSDSEALILLQDAYLQWMDKPTDTLNPTDEDTYTAIVASVFTPVGSSLKQIMYVRHGETYSFCTEDWADYAITKNVMANPFVLKERV